MSTGSAPPGRQATDSQRISTAAMQQSGEVVAKVNELRIAAADVDLQLPLDHEHLTYPAQTLPRLGLKAAA